MTVDDPKYQCGCGSRHVRQGAVVIAWIKIAISFIGYAGCFFLFGWYNIFPLLITFAICGMVIYGNKQEKSWMYIPFLILEGIEIFIYFLAAILCIVYAIVLPNENNYAIFSTNSNLTRNEFRVILIIVAILLFLILIFYSYVWIIIFRAYQFIRDEIEANRFGVRTMVYSQTEVGYPQVIYQSHAPQNIPQPPSMYQPPNYDAYEMQEIVVPQNTQTQNTPPHLYDGSLNVDSFES